MIAKLCYHALSHLTNVRWRWLLAFAGVTLVGIAGLAVLAKLRTPQTTAAQRGRVLVERLGCFGCHGEDGNGGVANPGAPEGVVPPLRAAAVLPAYVQGDGELYEWVRDGRPARLDNDNNRGAEVTKAAIRMPAFGSKLSTDELGDVVAYLRVIGGYEQPADLRVAAGRKLARTLGCFGCHGEDGRGALPNLGSFKGVIAPWDSGDFDTLVEDEQELRQWILDGNVDRLRSSKVAEYFRKRQSLHMPAYRDHISTDQLDELVAFIQWVRNPSDFLGEQDRWVIRKPIVTMRSAADRGRELYRSAGCVVCHGMEGRGGVRNGRSDITRLDNLADRMELFEPSDATGFITAIERGARLADRSTMLSIAEWPRVRELYIKYRDLIAKGSKSSPDDGHYDSDSAKIPMPAWLYRLNADPLDDIELNDIDAILAYLVSLAARSETTAL